MTFLRIVISLYFLFEHDLFGKPLHTYPDHAPARDVGCERTDQPKRLLTSGVGARRPGSFGSFARSAGTCVDFGPGAGACSCCCRNSVASKRTPGACLAVPEQTAVVPLKWPVSCASTSSQPNTVVGPSANRRVVNVAVKRSSSIS